MDTMLKLLENEAILTLLATIFASLWAAFKASDWVQARKEKAIGKALDCVAAGVEQAYKAYVREVKAASADGKLTDVERSRARELAFEAAQGFALSEGVNLARELGPELIGYYIEKAVAKAKAK